MSDDDTKFKHSKRIHKKTVKASKQVKIAKSYGLEVKEPHRYTKKHALNCGNPNCVMCMNPRKSRGEKTIQELKFDEITE